jgi:hypothetical protein
LEGDFDDLNPTQGFLKKKKPTQGDICQISNHITKFSYWATSGLLNPYA